MTPTIMPGDHILVDKTAYGYRTHSLPFVTLPWLGVAPRLPRRGDVAVFADPSGGESFFVKRVVALPGDTVTGLPTGISVNGSLLRGQRERPVPAISFETRTVPERHIFVAGDNAAISRDSRLSRAEGGLGFVPVSLLVGRASHVLLPAPREGADRISRIGALR
jgi:signal peptidase I